MHLTWATPRDGGCNAGTARRSLSGMVLFASLVLASPALAYAVPDTTDDASAATAVVRIAQAQPAPSPAPAAPAPAAPAPPAAAQPAASDEPIGNVATLTGTASVVRNQSTLPLKLKDDIYLNDVVTTFADSTLGITFNDETTFNLTAKASITIDNYIYEDGGKQNSALFDVTKGTVAFVASQVAKTGNMKIQTPTATLGIRGTTGLVEVNGAGGGAHNIKLYPDPDGHVGTIDVSDRSSGARLGSLNQGSSGFTVRPGAGGRVTAAPLAISPQQAARDQGVVRQVHAAQAVGRQVVTEQRALRRANPNRQQSAPPQRQNNLQQRPNNQPQQHQNNLQQRQNNPQQRQNNLQPRQNNLQQHPGPQQPGTPNRATERGQPLQPQTVQRPNQPAARQGALPNRPAAPPRRAPPPPKKPQKKR
jgi:hypothetical protein